MSLGEERLKIAHVVESGAETAEAGARRLAEAGAAPPASSPVEPADKARWLRVCITDLGADRPKVTVKLPLGLVDVGWRLGARFVPSGADAETEALLQAVRAEVVGRIVSFENSDYGERVEVFIE